MILQQQIAIVSEVKIGDQYNFDTGKHEKRSLATINWPTGKHSSNSIMLDNSELNLKYGDSVRVIITDIAEVKETDIEGIPF
jgi:hypothetical protein